MATLANLAVAEDLRLQNQGRRSSAVLTVVTTAVSRLFDARPPSLSLCRGWRS